jgi:hypothetical protein
VVQATNFAPGTTAADIEAAVQNVAIDSMGNSGLISCRILENNPTVMAEMVFSERYIANRVVETFNNQKADGRILHLYLSQESASSAVRRKKSEQSLLVPETQPATAPKDLFDNSAKQSEDVEMSTEASYDRSRDAADQDRRKREERHADPDVQDGRYGFSDGLERDRVNDQGREPRPPRNAFSERTDGRSITQRRDEAREKGYMSRYDDRRDERSSYDREGRYDDYRRDNRSSHYANGLAGGANRGSNSHGRMYSDSMARGFPRGGRDDRIRGRF